MLTDIADTLQHLQLDAEPETRTLLDIGDGPLSIVFELLSTPGIGIRSVAAGAQTCTALRDVLKDWHTRHENASSTKDLEAAELFFTDMMRSVGKMHRQHDVRKAMVSVQQGIALDEAQEIVTTNFRYDVNLLFDDVCRASGRSRATTARFLRLTETDGDPEKPDLLQIFELEHNMSRRAVFVVRAESDDRSEYEVVHPTEYRHVVGIIGKFGAMPLRVQDKLIAAGLVQNTPECLTGRAPWDDDADADTEEYSESEEEGSELADTESEDEGGVDSDATVSYYESEDDEEEAELDLAEVLRRTTEEFRSTGTVVARDRLLNAMRTFMESRGVTEQLGRRLDFDIDEQD